MKKFVVSLKDRSYSVFVGMRLLEENVIYSEIDVHNSSVVIITNNVVAPLYLDRVRLVFANSGSSTVDYIILPDGEKYKSMSSVEKIITFLLEKRFLRNVILVALGGGVIGDLTGFVASIYKRGVRFIQLPTTLLSQVDAAIGGKTGVNHILGKNMIGSYYQPNLVVIDLDFLQTLSRREFVSGLAEVIKYAILFDYNFFVWLESYLANVLLLDFKYLDYCVQRCCELKINVVEIDEYENNLRSLLNLGHTYAHAIESFLGYKSNWSHGEAVAVGILMAIKLSIILGNFNKLEAERIKYLFLRSDLPIIGPLEMEPEDYLPYIVRDKKNKIVGQLRLILPLEIGKAMIFENINYESLILSIKIN